MIKVMAEVVGKVVACMNTIWDNVGWDSFFKTKDVDEGEEYFDEVWEGHVGVGFEDGRPETNGAVVGVAVADECPEFDEDFAGRRGLKLGKGAFKELPEHEEFVCRKGVACHKGLFFRKV